MAIAIISAPITVFKDVEEWILAERNELSFTSVPFVVNESEENESITFVKNGYGECNTELRNIIESGKDMKRLVYEESKFYIYDDNRKIKAMFAQLDYPHYIKYNIFEDMREELNRAKIINIIFSKNPVFSFPNKKFWIHLTVDFGNTNNHLKVLDQSAKNGRRIVDIFQNEFNTVFFSIMSGLFIYCPIIYPEDPHYIAKFIESTGKAISANIRALEQKRKSISRARLLQNTAALSNLYINFDKTTEWYKKLFRNLFLIFFDNSQKKPIEIMEVRIDPSIAKYGFKTDLKFHVEYSYNDMKEYLRIRFSQYLVKFIYDLYEMSNKHRRKKGLKDFTVNVIEDNMPIICNESIRKIINNDTYFKTYGCIICADENY